MPYLFNYLPFLVLFSLLLGLGISALIIVYERQKLNRTQDTDDILEFLIKKTKGNKLPEIEQDKPLNGSSWTNFIQKITRKKIIFDAELAISPFLFLVVMPMFPVPTLQYIFFWAMVSAASVGMVAFAYDLQNAETLRRAVTRLSAVRASNG